MFNLVGGCVVYFLPRSLGPETSFFLVQLHLDLDPVPAPAAASESEAGKIGSVCIVGLSPIGVAVFSGLLKLAEKRLIDVRRIVLVGETVDEPITRDHLESDVSGWLKESHLWLPAADVLKGERNTIPTAFVDF